MNPAPSILRRTRREPSTHQIRALKLLEITTACSCTMSHLPGLFPMRCGIKGLHAPPQDPLKHAQSIAGFAAAVV